MPESLPPEDPRDVLIREQAARLAAQDEQIAGQAAQIGALTALVAGLREQLEAALRAGSRNSGSSSMPPSADDLPGRRPPAREDRRAAERAENKRNREPRRVPARTHSRGLAPLDELATDEVPDSLIPEFSSLATPYCQVTTEDAVAGYDAAGSAMSTTESEPGKHPGLVSLPYGSSSSARPGSFPGTGPPRRP